MSYKSFADYGAYQQIDVYKRQGDYIRQTSIVVIGVLITFAGSELVTQNSEKKDIQATMSVSYTHLDVYKRQPIYSVVFP